MNCAKLYATIIEKRRNNPINGYVETHHILPRSLGGSDGKRNLIKLTAREHFVCHLLLTRIYKNDRVAYIKMVKAFGMMLWMHGKNQQRYKVSSHKYQHLKEEFAKIRQEEQTGCLNSQFGSIWITDGIENKKINGMEEIPENWRNGRNLSSYRIQRYCKNCNIEFIYRKNGDYPKYCGSCRIMLRSRKSPTPIQSKNCVICNQSFFKVNVSSSCST